MAKPFFRIRMVKDDEGWCFVPGWRSCSIFIGLITSFLAFAVLAKSQIEQIPKNTKQIKTNYKISTTALTRSTGDRILLEAIVKKQFPQDQAELILRQAAEAERSVVNSIDLWDKE